MSRSTDDEGKVEPLEEIRDHIDGLDEQIQNLISERARLAQKVGASKLGETLKAKDYYRPEREAQVLRKVLERNSGPLRNEEMLRLFREIMSACLAQQEPLKVAFLGPEGTFTQAAVLKHYGHSVRALSLASIDEVFHEVDAGVADFGIVPVEAMATGCPVVALGAGGALESVCGEGPKATGVFFAQPTVAALGDAIDRLEALRAAGGLDRQDLARHASRFDRQHFTDGLEKIVSSVISGDHAATIAAP